MTQETDLESVLRAYFAADSTRPVELTVWVNNEGRVVAKVGTGVDAPEFIVFGNNVCQYPPPKPTTQRAQVQGIDAFKGMGAR